ncbi:MAG: hypothetical protein B7Y68_03570 [Thiotrichales bacterium 35-46-9]|nr:MAG: hypothetical protein B7Y68_03570 [Thiotrichales bacterium 35-46-9]OYZ42029.1 MAG: hypothetical protein B7Y18_01440 [Thiotrichales bacterium 24-47-4]
MKYPKIKSVKPLQNKRLWVEFDQGVEKIYDCSPLLQITAFEPLRQEWFFDSVQVDAGGYGISWSDEIDLAESELWLNGIAVAPASEAELMQFRTVSVSH